VQAGTGDQSTAWLILKPQIPTSVSTVDHRYDNVDNLSANLR